MGVKLPWISMFLFVIYCKLRESSSHAGIHSELNSSVHQLWKYLPQDLVKPKLGATERNITATVGSSVHLPCTVNNLKDRKLSWIRGKDLTVLAFDGVTYTSDRRFRVLHSAGSPEWVLEIRSVAETDEGLYDCQVNTHPKISTKVYLSVIPRPVTGLQREQPSRHGLLDSMASKHIIKSGQTVIPKSSLFVRLQVNGAWVEITEGSTFNISCDASGKWFSKRSHSSGRHLMPNVIQWKLDNVPIRRIFPQWKVKIEEVWVENSLTSRLLLNSVTPEDSGYVKCSVVSVESEPIELIVNEFTGSSNHQLYRGTSRSEEDYRSDTSSNIKTASSAKSGATTRRNNKFAILACVALSVVLMTNLVLCFHSLVVTKQQNKKNVHVLLV